MTTKSTGAIITDIIEAYGSRFGQWVRISEIAETAGLNATELKEAICELMEDDDFRAEPQPFRFRVTEADRAYAPTIGGEPRHLIRWM